VHRATLDGLKAYLNNNCPYIEEKTDNSDRISQIIVNDLWPKSKI
jgi:hypothetical protein